MRKFWRDGCAGPLHCICSLDPPASAWWYIGLPVGVPALRPKGIWAGGDPMPFALLLLPNERSTEDPIMLALVGVAIRSSYDGAGEGGGFPIANEENAIKDTNSCVE